MSPPIGVVEIQCFAVFASPTDTAPTLAANAYAVALPPGWGAVFVDLPANPGPTGQQVTGYLQLVPPSTSGAASAGNGILYTSGVYSVKPDPEGSIVVTSAGVKVGVLANDSEHGNRGGGGLHAVATDSTAGFLSAADKTKLDGITGGAAVASVSGSAPIVSSGGTTPAISINAATDSTAGSMSAADKTKLDAATASSTASTLALRDTNGGGAFSYITIPPISAPSSPSSGWTVYSDSADSNRLKAKNAAGQVAYLAPMLRTTSTHSFTANNTANNTIQIFQVTGAVRVSKLWGVVTTAMGANHTGIFFVEYDGTSAVNISASSSGNLNSAAVDSFVGVTGVAATQTSVVTNATGNAHAIAANQEAFQEFFLIQKAGVNTYVGYVYTTTDTPTSGAMTWTIEWEPLSADGNVVAV